MDWEEFGMKQIVHNLVGVTHLHLYEDGLEGRESVAVEVRPGCNKTGSEVGRELFYLFQQKAGHSREQSVLVVLEYEGTSLGSKQNSDIVVQRSELAACECGS
jgi:hypothetical protein